MHPTPQAEPESAGQVEDHRRERGAAREGSQESGPREEALPGALALTADEESLLLYFETCLVDGSGLVDSSKINNTDVENARKWSETRLIKFGHLKIAELKAVEAAGVRRNAGPRTHYIRFSQRAWYLAQKLRRERSARMIGRSEERFGIPEGLNVEDPVGWS